MVRKQQEIIGANPLSDIVPIKPGIWPAIRETGQPVQIVNPALRFSREQRRKMDG